MVALSPRETQVLEGILGKKKMREIGEQLGIRRTSIVQARRTLYKQIGAHGRADLIRYAVSVGLIPLADRDLMCTRRKEPTLRLVLEGRPQRPVAEGIGVWIKMMELMLSGLRQYARSSSTTALLRIIVELCGGLV